MRPNANKSKLHLSLMCALLLAATTLPGMIAHAQQTSGSSSALVVVVNRDSSIQTISPSQARRLFLGKSIKLPNGLRAKLATLEPLQTQFNQQALKRTDAQVDAAWSRLKFSGRAREPKAFTSAEALIQFIASSPNAIGYVSAADLTDQVREVLLVR